MPAVKNVGEPCAGEPHARIDGGREETSASRHPPRGARRLSPTRPTSRIGLPASTWAAPATAAKRRSGLVGGGGGDPTTRPARNWGRGGASRRADRPSLSLPPAYHERGCRGWLCRRGVTVRWVGDFLGRRAFVAGSDCSPHRRQRSRRARSPAAMIVVRVIQSVAGSGARATRLRLRRCQARRRRSRRESRAGRTGLASA